MCLCLCLACVVGDVSSFSIKSYMCSSQRSTSPGGHSPKSCDTSLTSDSLLGQLALLPLITFSPSSCWWRHVVPPATPCTAHPEASRDTALSAPLSLAAHSAHSAQLQGPARTPGQESKLHCLVPVPLGHPLDLSEAP